MRLASLTIAALLLASSATPALSQSSALAPEKQFHIDVMPLGLGAGVAGRVADNYSAGISITAGGNWWNYMVLGGRHFADPRGFSYEPKDGASGKTLADLLQAQIFLRRHFANGRHLDLGLKAAGFLHMDSSDDDPGGGLFLGANVSAFWYKRGKMQVGSEMDIGSFSEGKPEFGVKVAPLKVRFAF